MFRTDKMETAKKARKVQRMAFTKSLNSFREQCANANISIADWSVALLLLEARMTQLEGTQAEYVESLITSETAEEDIQKEIESHDTYKKDFLTARLLLLRLEDHRSSPTANGNASANVPQIEKPFKIPTIEIPKFNGNVSTWLKF